MGGLESACNLKLETVSYARDTELTASQLRRGAVEHVQSALIPALLKLTSAIGEKAM